MTELKPCPFCGGRAILMETVLGRSNKIHKLVLCIECGIRTHWYTSSKTPISRWNRRGEE